MLTFGEKLRADRERLQLSQEQLAKLLDVSQQAVANWENGTSHPRKDRRVKLLEVLGPDAELVKNPPTTDFIPVEDLPAVTRTMPDATIGTLKGAVNVEFKTTGIISRAMVGTPTFTDSTAQPWVGFSTADGKIVQVQAERTQMLVELQDALPEQLKGHVGADLMFGQVARQYDYASDGVVVRVVRANTASSSGFTAMHVVRLAMAVSRHDPSPGPSPSVVLFVLSNESAALVTRRMGGMHFDAMTLGIKIEVVVDVKAIAKVIVELERAYAQEVDDFNAWVSEVHRRADEHVFDPRDDAPPGLIAGNRLRDAQPPESDPPEKGSW